MNVLYIPSGYKRIYEYFDQCIVKEFRRKKISCRTIHPSGTIENFQSLCKRFKPDIAITMIGDKLHLQKIKWLQKQNVRVALWLTEDPYYIDQSLRYIPHYDYIFTIDQSSAEFYKEYGYKNIYQLSLGTDPTIFKSTTVPEKFKSDICMVGFPYSNRIHLIQSLLENSTYKILLVGMWENIFNGKRYPNLKIQSGWSPPNITAKYYNGAKIILNTDRPHDEIMNRNSKGIKNRSVNNRTFDVAGCGRFQLIQHIRDISSFYKLKKEIVSFQDEKDLLLKINYYMKNEQKREKIARRAQRTTIQHHCFSNRVENLLSVIQI